MIHNTPTNRTQDAIKLASRHKSKPRARRDRHGAGAEACQAKGEALGAEKAERMTCELAEIKSPLRVYAAIGGFQSFCCFV